MTGPRPGALPAESGPLLSPGFWLHQAALRWRAELDGRLRPLDLTHTQFLVLASAGWLEHVEGPPTQQAVAEQAGADRMMTSKVVRVLVDRDLLTRRPDTADGRAVRVTLTARGRALIRRATAVARAVDEDLFGPAPDALRNSFRTLASGRLRAPGGAPRGAP